jgi:hypothetical protein
LSQLRTFWLAQTRFVFVRVISALWEKQIDLGKKMKKLKIKNEKN